MSKSTDRVAIDLAFKVAAEVQEALGEDYIVGVFPLIFDETPRVSVTRPGATRVYPYSDHDIAERARNFFERRREAMESAGTIDEDLATREYYDRAAEYNSLSQEVDRLKAENLDLKRKLRAAWSEVTRYQKEYIDLLERRGQ